MTGLNLVALHCQAEALLSTIVPIRRVQCSDLILTICLLLIGFLALQGLTRYAPSVVALRLLMSNT